VPSTPVAAASQLSALRWTKSRRTSNSAGHGSHLLSKVSQKAPSLQSLLATQLVKGAVGRSVARSAIVLFWSMKNTE
jgi:hypothetical protein